ncbi:MAG: TRAP transporter large permease [Chloroflexi bacterium]|nr:TRAP transporter large permease [Chloroflexota bacterium]
MDQMALSWAGMLVVIILVVLGMPIAFVTALVGLVGTIILRGFAPAGTVVGGVPWSETANYPLIVIPFFIMMVYFASYARITTDLYWAARSWFGHLPGGLAIATTWGTALWSAISGSSTATAAVMGRLAVPEMLKYGYDRRLATGCVAAGAAMDALIPPSVVMIIYGIFTETSIGQLLIAGFIPGFMEAFSFALLIYVMAKRNPALAPPGPRSTWGQRFGAIFLSGNWAFLIIFALVFGGIYSGWFTPTEAGGIGAFLTLLTALALRRLSWRNLVDSLQDTGRITVMLFAIIAGVLVFMHFLGFTGFTKTMTEAILGLDVPPLVILIGFLLIYLLLGMFMDAIGMMALTLPLFHPIAQALGFNDIWFGILVVKMIEIGLITPPVGLNVYVMKGTVPQVPTHEIFRGTMPFLAVQVANTVLILLVPGIVLWLPSTMFGK